MGNLNHLNQLTGIYIWPTTFTRYVPTVYLFEPMQDFIDAIYRFPALSQNDPLIILSWITVAMRFKYIIAWEKNAYLLKTIVQYNE